MNKNHGLDPSIHLLPSHPIVTGISMTLKDPEVSSSIVNCRGLESRSAGSAYTEKVWVSQLSCGTAAWLRTKCSLVIVQCAVASHYGAKNVLTSLE